MLSVLHISYAKCHWCDIIYGYVLNVHASTKNLRLATWKRAVRIIGIYECMRIRRCPDVKSNPMFSVADLLFIMFTITFDIWPKDICSHLPQAMLGLYTQGQSMSKIPHSIRYLDVCAMKSIPIPSSHHFIKCQVYNANLSHGFSNVWCLHTKAVLRSNQCLPCRFTTFFLQHTIAGDSESLLALTK